MDTDDDILWDNECNDVCINDVVYGNGNEPCRSRLWQERLQTPTHRAHQTVSRLLMIMASPAMQEQISAPKSLLALILLVVILEVTLSFESWNPRQANCWC